MTQARYSLATERAVSHYKNIKAVRRTTLKQETINCVMHVSLNGHGTAFYDPRPAVFEFLKIKERRNRQPCNELYKDRDFIKKFFQKENGTLCFCFFNCFCKERMILRLSTCNRRSLFCTCVCGAWSLKVFQFFVALLKNFPTSSNSLKML